jgi:hypothetical protein
MEEKVRRELDGMKEMVRNWKESYLRDAPPGGGGEFLVDDLLQEIQEFVYPYTRRLFETNHIDENEAREFLESCYAEARELLSSLRIKR